MRRYGFDLSGRAQLTSWLYFDADVNLSNGRSSDTLFGYQKTTNYYMPPLAPTLTSVGGLTFKVKGFEGSLLQIYAG